jgi:hypothetical protein
MSAAAGAGAGTNALGGDLWRRVYNATILAINEMKYEPAKPLVSDEDIKKAINAAAFTASLMAYFNSDLSRTDTPNHMKAVKQMIKVVRDDIQHTLDSIIENANANSTSEIEWTTHYIAYIAALSALTLVSKNENNASSQKAAAAAKSAIVVGKGKGGRNITHDNSYATEADAITALHMLKSNIDVAGGAGASGGRRRSTRKRTHKYKQSHKHRRKTHRRPTTRKTAHRRRH